jgi:hypothetical protein
VRKALHAGKPAQKPTPKPRRKPTARTYTIVRGE